MNVYEIGEGYGIASIRQVNRPTPVPAAGQVLLKMKAFSLNYRDSLVVNGISRWKPPVGRVPVSDGVGEIVAVGPGVGKYQTGDRVAGLFLPDWIDGKLTPEKSNRSLGGAGGDGLLAEYVVLSEDEVIPVPTHLTDAEAATLPCAALTAWHALMEEGKAQVGESVLIQGTGGVSLFALQFALIAGLEVFLISGSDEKLVKAGQLGVKHLINYREQPDWAAEILRRTGGNGVDHVVEVVGGDNLHQSVEAVRTTGSIYMIGFLKSFEAQINIQKIMGKQIRLQGIEVGSRAMFSRMNQAIRVHALQPVIDGVFAFDQFPEALRRLEDGQQFGKVCIRME